MNTKTKNLIAITIGIWVCTFAYFQEWREGLKPGLLVVDRVLASEPQEASHEVLEEKGIVYDFSNSESVIISESTEGKIKRKIEAVFGDKAEEAKLICGCESRYNPTTWGDTTTEFKSVGLFQIRELPERMKDYNLTTEDLENIDRNIEMGKIIYDEAGSWVPWYNCGIKEGLIN